MPHKYVTKEFLQNFKDEIAGCDTAIGRIKRIGEGSADSMKELAEQIRSLMDEAREKKDRGLDLMVQSQTGNLLPADFQEKSALIHRGREKAFELILDLLEKPDMAIQYYESERTMIQAELDSYSKNYEVR